MQKTKFESPHWLSDEEILKLGISANDVEMFRRANYQKAFGIPTWYPALKQHTFRSEWFDLTFEEKSALACSEELHTDEHLKVLDGIEKKIGDLLQNKFPNGAFLKLNTRSPKDVPIYDFDNKVLWDIIKNEVKSKPGYELDVEHQLWSFVKGCSKYLKITNAKHAMKLLKSSQRIKEDMRKILPHPHELLPAQIVLREWVDEVAEHPEMEFRAFVYKKNLNALSMYFSVAYSEELHKKKDFVRDSILSFHDKIKNEIPQESYVIDFYITEEGKVMIVELNPFHNGAGACLFSWSTDRELFFNGPFTFRIVDDKTPPDVDPEEALSPKWKKKFAAEYYPKSKQESYSFFIVGGLLLAATAIGAAFLFYKTEQLK